MIFRTSHCDGEKTKC